MTKLKSASSANQFIASHGQVRNLFMTGRYKNSAAFRIDSLAKYFRICNDIVRSYQRLAA